MRQAPRVPSSKSLIGRFLRLPLRLVPRSMAMPVLSGPLRGRRWIVGAATHGAWLGIYEIEKQLAFVDAVSNGETVYDVGAHAGFYTLLAAQAVGHGGRVVSFEPLPRNIEFLEKHIALNRLKNVVVFRGVVGSTSSTQRFSRSTGNTMGRVADDGEMIVESFVLDELVINKRIPVPSVVKIDVEGAELEVLSGARRIIEQNGPTFLIATHGSALRTECLRLLRGFGYTVRPLDSSVVEEANEFLAERRPAA